MRPSTQKSDSTLFLLFSHNWVGIPLPLQRTAAHKLGHHVIVDLGPALLEALHVLLQLGDAALLDLTSQHLTLLVGDANVLEFIIVLQEESKVLEGHIDLRVTTLLAVELGSVTTTREGELVDLVLDLIRGVAHEDSGGVDTSGHLRARSLEGRQEDGVDERWLLVLHLLGVFSALPEVWVLVDGARNQAGDGRDLFEVVAEDMGETGCECRGRLGGAEVELADVVAVVESECASDLIDRDTFCHPANVFVECATDEVEITENKGLLHVESNGNDILHVFLGKALGVGNVDRCTVHILLVVRHHDHEGYVENILQPSSHEDVN